MIFLIFLLILLFAGAAVAALSRTRPSAPSTVFVFAGFIVAISGFLAFLIFHEEGTPADTMVSTILGNDSDTGPPDIDALFEGRLDRYRPHDSALPTFSGEYETVVDGVEFATSLTAAPDGRLFVSEFRTGAIRQVLLEESGGASIDSFAEVPLPPEMMWEQGLWNVAVHPSAPYLYAAAIEHANPGVLHDASWRVVRFELLPDGTAGELEEVCTGLPGAAIHNGGSLAFGDDGVLYVGLGDVLNPAGVRRLNRDFASPRPVQLDDPSGLAGVILRIASDDCRELGGEALLEEAVYATGFRNPYGIAVAPDGTLFATENMEDCCDQVIRVEEGRNHGWPQYGLRVHDFARMQENRSVVAPLITTAEQAIAPTELVYLEPGDYLGRQPSLVYGAFHSGSLHRIILTHDGLAADYEEILVILPVEEMEEYQQDGGIIGVTVGADGYVYFSTPTTIYRLNGITPGLDTEARR